MDELGKAKFQYLKPEEIDLRIKKQLRDLVCNGGHTSKWSADNVLLRRGVIIDLFSRGYTYRRAKEEIMDRWGVCDSGAQKYLLDAKKWLTDDIKEFAEVKREEAAEKIAHILEECLAHGDRKNALAATDQINKLYGLYTDKKEVKVDGANLTFKFGGEE